MGRALIIKRCLWGAALTAAMLLGGGNAQAGGFGRRGIFRGILFAPSRTVTYDERREYLNYYYPKYVGGLHASYFNSLGVPPGDVGLRGNGFYMTPW